MSRPRDFDTSEMTYRSADQFQPKRQGRRHGKGGLVAGFFIFILIHQC